MTTIEECPPPVPLVLRWTYRVLEAPARFLLNRVSPSFQKDWFGSDIFERYTAAYTWLANQFGHFTIGGVLYLIGWLLFFLFDWSFAFDLAGTATCPAASGGAAFYWALVGAVLAWLLYVLKETADAVLALDVNADNNPRPFKADQRELALDGWTDAFFVLSGVVVTSSSAWLLANSACERTWANDAWLWLLPIIVCVVYASRRVASCLPEKRRFDESGLPLYFRLTRFNGSVEGYLRQYSVGGCSSPDIDVAREIEMVACGHTAHHVCIFGPIGAGRTALAAGIACNLGIRGQQTRYIKAMDFENFAMGGDNRDDCCTLDEAQTIVIDDVREETLVETMDKYSKTRPFGPLFILICDQDKDKRSTFVDGLVMRLKKPCLSVEITQPMHLQRPALSDVKSSVPVGRAGAPSPT